MTTSTGSCPPLTIDTAGEFAANFGADQAEDATFTLREVRQLLAQELREALATTTSTRNELLAQGIAKGAVDALYPTALQEMVRKIDTRDAHSIGYIATSAELSDILGELSKRMSVNIKSRPYSASDPELNERVLNIEISLGFAIERAEL